MEVYVEYVVLDNMIIDTLILLLTQFLLKLKTKKILIFLSSLVGTTFALLSPILSNIISTLIKLPLAFIMIYIAFKPKRIKQCLVILVCFFISTFTLMGACLGVCEIFKINYIVTNGLSYQYKFPVGYILLICYLCYLCFKNIIKYIFKRHDKDKFLYEIILQNNNQIIKAKAFLDSGNILEYKGKPISIINYKIFSKLYSNISVTDILLKKNLPLKNAKYYDIKSLADKQNILIFEINAIKIEKNEQKNAILGLSLQNFENGTNSDVIISSKLLTQT